MVLLDDILRKFIERIAVARVESKLQAIRRAHDMLFIKHLVLKILKEEGPLFKGLHAIVDSELDSDRLDYVSRDLFASGIYRDTIQYARLLSSYTLHLEQAGADKEVLNLQFLPSTRALSAIEDFFWQRVFLYR